MKVDLRGYNIHSTNINFQVGANSCDQLRPNVKVAVTPDQDILGLISEEGECILSFLTHCNTDKNRYLRLITGVNNFFVVHTFGDMPNGISNRSSNGTEVAFESTT